MNFFEAYMISFVGKFICRVLFRVLINNQGKSSPRGNLPQIKIKKSQPVFKSVRRVLYILKKNRQELKGLIYKAKFEK